MATATLTLASCIDEDLSGCGKEYAIDYTVRLHTNMNTEIGTELTTTDEQAYAQRLRTALGDVFTDWARDVDLSFFTGGSLARNETRQMDAKTQMFSLYLPVADYRHLAVANVAEEPLVNTVGGDALTTMALKQDPTATRQAAADTIGSQGIGLFTARLDMNVVDGQDQTFHVDLYMQNCACAVVIDPNGNTPTNVTGCVNGMATSFAISDSTYTYYNSIPVRMNSLNDDNFFGLYAAHFPSPDNAASDGVYWTATVNITMPDGKTTRNVLKVEEPLKAGNLKIIKAKLNSDGSLDPITQAVGVSIELDWKPGGTHDVEM